jgi:hypothetical protein
MPTTVWGWLCGIGPWALSWLYCAGRVPHGAFQLLLFASVPDGTWEQQTSQPRVLCVLVAFNVCTGIQSQRSLIPWAKAAFDHSCTAILESRVHGPLLSACHIAAKAMHWFSAPYRPNQLDMQRTRLRGRGRGVKSVCELCSAVCRMQATSISFANVRTGWPVATGKPRLWIMKAAVSSSNSRNMLCCKSHVSRHEQQPQKTDFPSDVPASSMLLSPCLYGHWTPEERSA